MRIEISIIIPTRDRAAMLRDTLDSLPAACAGQEDIVECLVIDNGSADSTGAVVEAFAAVAPFPVRRVYEPRPGLHMGRNLGATLARGEILAYLDDDVLVRPGWAAALSARFAADPANMLVGGPCRPHWEVPPPAWIETLRSPLPDGGWEMGHLSLIDMGETPKPVSGQYIFGCNFAIRRHFVLEAGGFHPDGLPWPLLRFRGDGESEMGQKVDEHPEYTAFYDPAAAVSHRVPASRLTREYLTGVAKRAGIGAGYSAYRACPPGLWAACGQGLGLARALLSAAQNMLKQRLKQRPRAGACRAPVSATTLHLLSRWHALTHFMRIRRSPVLRAWVKQPSYLPDAPCPYAENPGRNRP